MKHKKLLQVAATLCVLSLIAACAGPNTVMDTPSPSGDVAGFWAGLFHGFVAPFSFIASLLSDKITMYDVHNNGGWYDFGFVLGTGILFGGGGTQT